MLIRRWGPKFALIADWKSLWPTNVACMGNCVGAYWDYGCSQSVLTGVFCHLGHCVYKSGTALRNACVISMHDLNVYDLKMHVHSYLVK